MSTLKKKKNNTHVNVEEVWRLETSRSLIVCGRVLQLQGHGGVRVGSLRILKVSSHLTLSGLVSRLYVLFAHNCTKMYDNYFHHKPPKSSVLLLMLEFCVVVISVSNKIVQPVKESALQMRAKRYQRDQPAQGFTRDN